MGTEKRRLGDFVATAKASSWYRSGVNLSFPLRRFVGAAIPDAVSIRARAALGMLSVRQVDLRPLEILRSASKERLADPSYLEREVLPALGLSADAPLVFPAELHPFLGRGLQHWQYPIQFSKYLAAIAGYRIEKYLEIGVQHGGTFAITVEYLKRFSPLKAAYAADINRVPSLRNFGEPIVHVLRDDSGSQRFRRFVEKNGPFDLVLIDGDHSEAACQRDFDTVRPFARLIALHDITDAAWPGVGAVWRRLKEREAASFSFQEFTEQYPKVRARLGSDALGIGLAIRKDAEPAMSR